MNQGSAVTFPILDFWSEGSFAQASSEGTAATEPTVPRSLYHPDTLKDDVSSKSLLGVG